MLIRFIPCISRRFMPGFSPSSFFQKVMYETNFLNMLCKVRKKPGALVKIFLD